MKSRCLFIVLAALAVLLGSVRHGMALSYTIDFDSLAVGSDPSTIVTPFGNLHLTTSATHFDDDLNLVPSPLIVGSGFRTTSGDNYLGAAGGLSMYEQQFSGGHSVTIDLSGLSVDVVGISAHFVTNFNRYPLEDPFVQYPPGLFSVEAGGAAALSTLPSVFYDDLGRDFLVSLVVSTPFTTARLLSAADTGQTDPAGVFHPDFYSFTIDDITLTMGGTAPIPEPSTLLLLAGGLGVIAFMGRGGRK